MPIIGVSDFHYAILTKDDKTGVAYLDPKPIPGLQEVNIKPKSETAQYWGDNKVLGSASTLSDVDVEINLADLPLHVQAEWGGHSYVNGAVSRKAGDVAPELAIGFKSQKDNGSEMFVWLPKGKFGQQESSHKTKTEKIEFQHPKIAGKFYARIFDDEWKLEADEEDPNYMLARGETWFDSVGGAVDNTVLTITASTPANDSAMVGVNSTLTWTFSKEVLASTANGASFFVQTADGNTQIAGTVTLDATRKVVAFKPTVALTAATQYMAIVTSGVKDLYGNALAAAYVTKFTTA